MNTPFTVNVSHLHDNVFEHGCEAISGRNCKIARNCLTSTFKNIVMQMRKGNCEKGYCLRALSRPQSTSCCADARGTGAPSVIAGGYVPRASRNVKTTEDESVTSEYFYSDGRLIMFRRAWKVFENFALSVINK